MNESLIHTEGIDAEFFLDVLKYGYQKKRDICTKHYYSFLKLMWPTVCSAEYVHNWSTEYLCDELQIIGNRIINRKPKLYDLIVNLPPGETKTINISQLWNVWLWINNPKIRMLSSSVNFGLSVFNSMKTKDCLNSELFRLIFKEIKFKEDLQGKGHFMIPGGGERNTTSVGGEPVGFHYDAIVLDDLIGAKTILTQAKIEQCREHIGKVVTRKTDPKVSTIIFLGQRMGIGDPTDILKEVLPKVKHIILPSEDRYDVQPPELRKYYVNGLLNPHRKPLYILKEEMTGPGGMAAYDAQYGQRPANAEGKMIKKEDFIYKNIRELPQGFFSAKKYACGDTAYTEDKKKNDPSGFLIWSYYNNILYLLDFWEMWEEAPQVSRRLKKMQDDGVELFHIEAQASGSSISQVSRQVYGVNVKPYVLKKKLGKKERLFKYISVIEGRRVVIVYTEDNKTRMDHFVHCVTQFPDNAVHDEAVDTLSMTLDLITLKTSKRSWR